MDKMSNSKDRTSYMYSKLPLDYELGYHQQVQVGPLRSSLNEIPKVQLDKGKHRDHDAELHKQF